VTAVVAESRQALARASAKSSRGRILPQDRAGELAVEIQMARELGKTLVDQAMQLIEARDQLLRQVLPTTASATS
jgi:hypothetical protein